MIFRTIGIKNVCLFENSFRRSNCGKKIMNFSRFVFLYILFSFGVLCCQQVKKTEQTLNIHEQIQRIKINQKIDATLKQNLISYYQKALQEEQKTKIWQKKAREYKISIAKIPIICKTLDNQINTFGKILDVESFDLESIDLYQQRTKLEENLRNYQERLNRSIKNLTQLKLKIEKNNSRLQELPKLIAGAEERLLEVKSKMETKPSKEKKELLFARNVFWKRAKKTISEEIKTYKLEIRYCYEKKKLLFFQERLENKKIKDFESWVKFWREKIYSQRREKAEQEAKEARQAAKAAQNSHPIIKKLTENIAILAEKRGGSEGLVAKISWLSREYEIISGKLNSIEKESKRIQEKIRTAGLTNAIGFLLRKRLSNIPNIRLHQRRIQKRQNDIPDIQLEIVEIEEQEINLNEIDGKIDVLLENLSAQEKKKLLPLVKKLLLVEKKYLDQLLKDYNVYFLKLVDLDNVERKFIKEVIEYQDFIQEHILWVRSTKNIGIADFKRAWSALGWLCSLRNWRSFSGFVYHDFLANLFVYLTAIVFFLFLLFIRHTCYQSIQEIAKLTISIKTDKLIYSLNVFFYTLGLVLLGPSILYFFSWRLTKSMMSNEFIFSIANGLGETANVWLGLAFLYKISLSKGLGEAHFGWNSEITEDLRKNLFRFMIVALPGIFIISSMEKLGNDLWISSLGRLCFIIIMINLSIFFTKIMIFSKAFQEIIMKNSIWLKRLRYIYIPTFVIFPLSLIIIAIAGYYYTAWQLITKFTLSVLSLVTIIIIYSSLLRWLAFSRRNLRLMTFLRFVKKQQKKIEENSDVSAENLEKKKENKATDENTVKKQGQDLLTLAQQARIFVLSFLTLFFLFTLWIIWDDVFPALKKLDTIQLWSYTAKVSQVTTGTGTSTVTREVTQKMYVTLSHLIYSILLFFMTIIAGRNLPGLLEISILQRIQMEKGARFAITAVSKYLILLIGFIIGFHMIGISWSKVQWLAAAFTVGLGFGLQEIFANFVSGIIILFERPIRVGDVVTIGDKTGIVTRIQIRATTITDWDNKELIVPNKDFITSRLINWSLSNTLLRLVVPVGIAYGSDTEKASQILMKIAEENPHVLKDPPPKVLFKEFGDSALLFELRIFIPHIDYYVKTLHSLHMTIEKSFREENIVIAFPQMDLHLCSLEPEAKDVITSIVKA